MTNKLTGNWKSITRMKNVDEIFDIICFENYVRGKFNLNVPVDESRNAFKRIKDLLQNKKRQL